MMEMAKVTSKGQITIPISIRRRLGINEGDKILFINKADGVMMLNPDSVGGDISQYTEDAVAIDSGTVAAPAPAPAAPSAPAAIAAATEKPVAASAPVSPSVTSVPYEPQRRKFIPPVAEPEEKPAASAGGIDLSTLLDDIRSIGSNI